MLTLDLNSSKPLYLEISNAIIKLILNGTFKARDKLPSIRSLSKSLSINHNTVQRAYLELEHRGFIYSQSGKGMYVKDNIEKLCLQEKSKIINSFKDKMNDLKELGFNQTNIIDIVKENY
ncbi:MAG: GntR family transcriptional regulator [Erysipelotrichales bacterium]